jgi:8-hydroxy-5-deazaflavin:NADPH oxidoreductase
MTVCVLGGGAMGWALARRMLDAGVEVRLSSRDLDKAAHRARREARDSASVAVLPALDALEGAIYVVLALPFQAAIRLATGFPGFAEGRIVIDVTNPLSPRGDDLVVPYGSSAAVELARRIPYCRLVKAFNTLTADQLDSGSTSLSTYVAGEDAEARAAVATLAVRMGIGAVDIGPLTYCRHVEGLVLLRRVAEAARAGAGRGSDREP